MAANINNVAIGTDNMATSINAIAIGESLGCDGRVAVWSINFRLLLPPPPGRGRQAHGLPIGL